MHTVMYGVYTYTVMANPGCVPVADALCLYAPKQALTLWVSCILCAQNTLADATHCAWMHLIYC